MKVGFDISQIAHRGGVASYTENLTNLLSKNPNLETVYFYSSLRKPYVGNLAHVKKFKIPPSLFEIMFNRFRKIPIETFIGNIDIFHSSDWVQPPTRAKKITTYHDVIPLLYPQWSKPEVVKVHKRRLEIVEKEIDLVIAVSNSTKKDLISISKIPDNKIKVVYEGVSDEFKVLEANIVERFKIKYSLPQEFILSIGGIGERKNIERIKKAAEGKNLVIVGIDIPYLETEELPLLYNASSMLLYPSLYEGFGLPILEAMACGIPVITSNTSSMPEIGGDAVLYVNPFDVEDIKQKIEDLEDKSLIKELVAKGLKRAKQFTWEKCAKETCNLYNELMKK